MHRARAPATISKLRSIGPSKRSPGEAPLCSAHHGDRHRQDRRRFSNLLEAVVVALEPDRRAPETAHSYLADRNFLVDDPKDKIFAPFGDARYKIENGEVNLGREMYFAIYQALAETSVGPGCTANIRLTSSI